MKRKMKLARCMQHDDSVHDSGTRRKGYRRNPGVFLKHEDRVPPSAGAWRGGASPVSRIRAHAFRCRIGSDAYDSMNFGAGRKTTFPAVPFL